MLSENDIKTAEDLASQSNLEDLSKALLVMTDLERIEQKEKFDIKIIEKAIALVCKEVFYVFSGKDELAGEVNDGEEHGVAVYRRRGNQIKNLRTNLYSVEKALEILKKEETTRVFTGNIDGEFMDITESFSTEHNGYDLEITRGQLSKEDSDFLTRNGITITILKILG